MCEVSRAKTSYFWNRIASKIELKILLLVLNKTKFNVIPSVQKFIDAFDSWQILIVDVLFQKFQDLRKFPHS